MRRFGLVALLLAVSPASSALALDFFSFTPKGEPMVEEPVAPLPMDEPAHIDAPAAQYYEGAPCDACGADACGAPCGGRLFAGFRRFGHQCRSLLNSCCKVHRCKLHKPACCEPAPCDCEPKCRKLHFHGFGRCGGLFAGHLGGCGCEELAPCDACEPKCRKLHFHGLRGCCRPALGFGGLFRCKKSACDAPCDTCHGEGDVIYENGTVPYDVSPPSAPMEPVPAAPKNEIKEALRSILPFGLLNRSA